MLDVRAIREDPEPFRRGPRAPEPRGRGRRDPLVGSAPPGAHRARSSSSARTRTAPAKAIGAAEGEEKQRLIEEVGKVSARLKELEPELERADADLADLLAETPNVPHDSAPDGFTEEDAVEVRSRGEPPSFDFEPRDHAELGGSWACWIPSAARGPAARASSTCWGTSCSSSSRWCGTLSTS